MMRHVLTLAILIAATLSGLTPTTSAVAEDKKFEPLIDLEPDSFRGEPPSQTKIEAAYKECLKQIDDEVSELKKGASKKKEHIKSETSICDHSRRECIVNPRSVECRGFVEDYADSM